MSRTISIRFRKTIRARVLLAIDASPVARSATEIAHWINEHPASVSSECAKLWRLGSLDRKARADAPKPGAWLYGRSLQCGACREGRHTDCSGWCFCRPCGPGRAS